MATNNNKVGFAVVGLGSIVQNAILPAFVHSKKTRLVAVVSGDSKKAKRMARKLGVAASYSYDEFGECLRDPSVGAVYIATPPGRHAEFTLAATRAGKHVLCEKPLAATVPQAERMTKACKRDGVLLMTAYRKYFEPSSVYLRRLIREDVLGRVDLIHTSFSEVHTAGVSPAWLLDRKLAGGGPLMDLGVYCVNTTRWLVDEDPVKAEADWWRHDRRRFRDVEEGIAFRLQFASGLRVQGSASYGAALSSFLFVQGSKGWVGVAPAFEFDQERRLTGKVAGKWLEKKFKMVDEFALELDAFAASILTGRPVECDGEQERRDVVILQAIYKAARTGKRVGIRY